MESAKLVLREKQGCKVLYREIQVPTDDEMSRVAAQALSSQVVKLHPPDRGPRAVTLGPHIPLPLPSTPASLPWRIPAPSALAPTSAVRFLRVLLAGQLHHLPATEFRSHPGAEFPCHRQ
jgi:hypothetical protein